MIGDTMTTYTLSEALLDDVITMAVTSRICFVPTSRVCLGGGQSMSASAPSPVKIVCGSLAGCDSDGVGTFPAQI